MKKIIYLLSIIFLVIVFIPTSKAKTNHPLDYIETYDITVNTRSDATLDFDYRIKWKVLDSSSEGPLEWVKIGIPNKYVDEIKILSTDISKAKYYIDGTSTCIRLDLSKKFYKDEVCDLHFSFHQSRMFTLMEEESLTTYEFMPGWFSDIEVGKLTVKWNKTDVHSANTKYSDNEYHIWQTHLDQGETTSCQVSYKTEIFPNINKTQTYVNNKDRSDIMKFLLFFVIVVIIVVILCYIAKINTKPSYYRSRGFYPAYMHRWFFYRPYYYGVNDKGSRKTNPYHVVSSGGSGHSGHSCACACACACAGGGRAGCSKKDFYNNSFKIDKLIDDKK